MDRCRFAFSFGTPLLPALKVPARETAMAYLRRLCDRAWREKYRDRSAAAARTRMLRELAVIDKHHFADYFLYVNDIIGFCYDHDIPVEVRGSAASSVISYLLGFTHCCPLEHDLYFERFMNPGRRDCPDIDIDIADNRRDEVIQYCYSRWGEDHVAMIATISTYRTRSAVHDAGRILRLPPDDVQRFLDRGASIAQETQLLRIAGRLVGLPRHLGIHCGGLVITPCPLTDITPLARATKGVVISHYEKDQAEAIGLVKMDLLGNSALSVINESIAWLDRRGKSFVEPGPRFDYKVKRLFANGDTLGIYQCESPGMRQLCRALEPGTPKEAAAALSLIRPGPAAAGMKDAFIRRRRGLEPVTYLHPRMATFLKSTYGVMLYQEDVMKVAVNLAGYSIADADLLRRAVSKKRAPGVFADERSKFIFTKAAAAGIREEVAADIWKQVSRFASYSYCKAHASVYGRLAWLTARLKAHHPREFFTAVLNCHKSMYPKRVFVWDALRHGIPVLPVAINASEVKWIPTPQGVRAGFGIIKGLRHSLCQQLAADRRRGGAYRNLRDLRRRVAFNVGELERLILVGACRDWGTREALLNEVWATGAYEQQLTLFTGTQPALPSLLESELLLTEIPFCMHPVNAQTCRQTGACTAADMGMFINRVVEMTGILDSYKLTRTKDGGEDSDEMSFVTLEDGTGLFELVLFPEQHAKYGQCFSTIGPYRVRGIVREQWDSLTLELREAECRRIAC